MVEITHPNWRGWKGLVTACLYPVEEGLQVTTENQEIHQTRKTVLDLLLARCPDAPYIRKLAAEHGVTNTTFKRNEVETVCILCGLCVRVCAVKGSDAIGTARRGIRREIAAPFGMPPPDCIGCTSCAHICPTDAIPWEDVNGVRKIWEQEFEMVKCVSCGRPIMPIKQLEFEAQRAGISPDYMTTCPACSQTKTLETIRASFKIKRPAFEDAVEAAS
jgi:predicted molibdopterin-dependent oxidoreductase YjgC